jgi:cytoskeletal protein CcmA (bactofilin family)
MENNPPDKDQENSLESTDTSVESSSDNKPDPKKKKKRLSNLLTHLNIYLLLFILIVILAAGVVYIGYQRNKKIDTNNTINTQPLSQDELNKLKNSDASVGDPKQTLSIESNAIFSGKVLIRDSLDVAGTIKVGGSLSLPGLTVAGTSNFDQLVANRLSIAGDTVVQGRLTVQKDVNVSGGATFGGAISAPSIVVQKLQVNGDLQIPFHIDSGGSSPSRTNGSALGGGGTTSLNGTDTAGTLTINTGGGPSAGCFATINFAKAFNGTPHVSVTPIGSAAAGLNYYVNRTQTNMSICTTNPAPAGQSFSFDYIVLD